MTGQQRALLVDLARHHAAKEDQHKAAAMRWAKKDTFAAKHEQLQADLHAGYRRQLDAWVASEAWVG